MHFDYSNPKESNAAKLLRPLARLVINIMFKPVCIGKENIPESGSFIVASNHVQYFDPVIISVYFPRAVHFMAKSEVFENRIFAFFLSYFNCFPVKRGAVDRTALEYAEKIIDNGWLLGIFPEGKRSRDGKLQKSKNGLAYLAKKTKADVLPLCIYKTPGETGRRKRITVRIGGLIKNSELFTENGNSNQDIKNATSTVMDSITELWNMKHGENNEQQ